MRITSRIGDSWEVFLLLNHWYIILISGKNIWLFLPDKPREIIFVFFFFTDGEIKIGFPWEFHGKKKKKKKKIYFKEIWKRIVKKKKIIGSINF